MSHFCFFSQPSERLLDNDDLQGSVATRLRCAEFFNNRFSPYFLITLLVNFFKSVSVQHNYCKNKNDAIFNSPIQYRILMHCIT